ncbi:hypothetical protein L6252_00175 [Candidatus Parcubacteria bacterium]|nr:hypothetical protein [Candidatus Parcubacteria bacterium]
MAPQITTIEKGVITLPKKIQQAWQGADVWLQTSNDTIVIKRLSPLSLTLSEMATEFRQATQKAKITKRDILDVAGK